MEPPVTAMGAAPAGQLKVEPLKKLYIKGKIAEIQDFQL